MNAALFWWENFFFTKGQMRNHRVARGSLVLARLRCLATSQCSISRWRRSRHRYHHRLHCRSGPHSRNLSLDCHLSRRKLSIVSRRCLCCRWYTLSDSFLKIFLDNLFFLWNSIDVDFPRIFIFYYYYHLVDDDNLQHSFTCHYCFSFILTPVSIIFFHKICTYNKFYIFGYNI